MFMEQPTPSHLAHIISIMATPWNSFCCTIHTIFLLSEPSYSHFQLRSYPRSWKENAFILHFCCGQSALSSMVRAYPVIKKMLLHRLNVDMRNLVLRCCDSWLEFVTQALSRTFHHRLLFFLLLRPFILFQKKTKLSSLCSATYNSYYFWSCSFPAPDPKTALAQLQSPHYPQLKVGYSFIAES